MTPNKYPIREWPPCEVCGKPTTSIVHDISRDESVEESHFFCRDHSRPSNILSNKDRMLEKDEQQMTDMGR